MPAASFKDGITTGHGCHPRQDIIEGSSNVFINGNDAARDGDAVEAHTCGDDTHSGTLTSGSSTVFINGKAAIRIGDEVDCGGFVSEGSTDVFIGG